MWGIVKANCIIFSRFVAFKSILTVREVHRADIVDGAVPLAHGPDITPGPGFVIELLAEVDVVFGGQVVGVHAVVDDALA
jgi:hypothetical protein